MKRSESDILPATPQPWFWQIKTFGGALALLHPASYITASCSRDSNLSRFRLGWGLAIFRNGGFAKLHAHSECLIKIIERQDKKTLWVS